MSRDLSRHLKKRAVPALIAALLLLPLCGPDAAATPAARRSAADRPTPSGTAGPPRVLYLGDSIATESQDALGEWIRAGGPADYTSLPYSGMTVCDYLEGRPESSFVPDRHKAAALVRSLRPTVVVLQFWGNAWAFTPCMHGVEAGSPDYYTRYRADVAALTDQITAAARDAGAARPVVVWVLQGPDAFRPERVRRINSLYAAQADGSGDVVSDAGREVSMAAYPYDNLPHDRYAWTQYLPCDRYEREHPAFCTDPGSYGGVTRLHRDDDALHYCLAPVTADSRACPVPSPGVLRYSRAIARTVDGLRGAR
ncbi:SGNH/GDSL hydrolase family protein [Streptomyces sp. NPDC001922]|uniref:SGNH/GDSL hydrolase family protein n=1 Tax=Streptomyces sp. NPDC001922 TaxID=3364624 RepID=UPI003679EA34